MTVLLLVLFVSLVPHRNSFTIFSPTASNVLRRDTSKGLSKGIIDSSMFPQSGYDTSVEYERFLYSKKKNKKRPDNKNGNEEVDEDGYASMMRVDRPLWKSALLLPLRAIRQAASKVITYSRNNNDSKAGTLILIRHGESSWNQNKTFTGWADPDLSQQGCREVEHAARLLLEGGYSIDVVFTSRLKRAIRSTWILLGEMNQLFLPVFKSWRLNERNYGALTGLCKMETAQQLGIELVQSWRGSLKSRPPAISQNSIYWPGRDRRYSDLLQSNQIPFTESLLDCMERTRPLWDDKISHELRMGRNVLVVAHANTLRGLVKIIDNIGDEDIQQVSIPTGIPIIYKFQKCGNTLILPNNNSNGSNKDIPVASSSSASLNELHMSGIFLEKPGMLKEALKREKEWIENVPGYSQSMNMKETPMSPLERSLSKLALEKELKDWAGQFVDLNQFEEDDGTDGGNMGKKTLQVSANQDAGANPTFPSSDSAVTAAISASTINVTTVSVEDEGPIVTPNMITRNDSCLESPSTIPEPASAVPIRRDATIVLIRHGKTEHNKLGLFTGWQDAPLASEGRIEAKRAGQLLKMHGFEFDVVFTSWLSRAIETAWLVMDEMDCIWLPLVKTWRLNERMVRILRISVTDCLATLLVVYLMETPSICFCLLFQSMVH